MFSIVFAFVLLLLLVVFHVKNRRFLDLAAKIPGPFALPLFGNGLQISTFPKGILAYMCANQKKYGPVTRHWLGRNLYTFLSKPEDLEILLKDTINITKSPTYNFLKPWLGNGLVTSTGEHWHLHRRIITPSFHFNILEKFVEIFNERGNTLIENLEHYANGEVFDIFPKISAYALDVMLESAMGIKNNEQSNYQARFVNTIQRLSRIIHTRNFNPLLRPDFVFKFTNLGKQQRELIGEIDILTQAVTEQRRREFPNRGLKLPGDDLGANPRRELFFLDLLLLSQENGSDLSDLDLRDEVNTFAFAGYDTTTTAICFAIYHLANNPEIQEKCHEEIVSTLGEDPSNFSIQEMSRLKYLDQVIKEVLRISPPFPFVSRTLSTDLKIRNYTLPAGSAVSTFIYMLHHDPEIYPEPEKFDPERFCGDNVAKRHPFAYLPFSAGLRNCIGQKFALLEIKATLIKLLRGFKIQKGDPINNLQVFLVLHSPKGYRIKLERRN